jgi:hypothetical protein
LWRTLEPLEQTGVRRGKLECAQLSGADPHELLAAERPRFTLHEAAAQELEPNPAGGIVVRYALDHLANLDLDPEFLAQLAAQTLGEGLSRLPLPTRELPQATEVISWAPARQQEAALAEDQAGGDVDGFERVAARFRAARV